MLYNEKIERIPKSCHEFLCILLQMLCPFLSHPSLPQFKHISDAFVYEQNHIKHEQNATFSQSKRTAAVTILICDNGSFSSNNITYSNYPWQ